MNANSGTSTTSRLIRTVGFWENLAANRLKAISLKTLTLPRDSRAPERWPSGTICVRVYDDQPFDGQLLFPRWRFAVLNMSGKITIFIRHAA
ncbi:phage tail tip protein [Shigella flexneri]